MSANEPIEHFGLGEDVLIERLIVKWPSGHEQVFENLAVNRIYFVTEPAGPAPEHSTSKKSRAALYKRVSDISKSKDPRGKPRGI